MATLSADSIQANNLLSQIRALALEDNQPLDELICVALYVSFAYAVINNNFSQNGHEDNFEMSVVNKDTLNNLREIWDKIHFNIVSESSIYKFLDCVDNIFRHELVNKRVVINTMDNDTLYRLYQMVLHTEMTLKYVDPDSEISHFYIFDRLFYALNNDVSISSERFCGRLLSLLSFHRDALVAEVPFVTGELAVEKDYNYRMHLNSPPPYSLPLLMRMFLYRLNVHNRKVADVYYIRQARTVPHRFSKETDSIAIGALVKFSQWPKEQPFLALIGIDGRLRKQDVDKLFDSGLLLAVVEIPAVLKSKSNRLLVLTNVIKKEKIVFIDTSLVIQSRKLDENIQAEFVAAIFLKHLDLLGISKISLNNDTRQLLERILPGEYRDVPGLCKSIERNKVTHKNQLNSSVWIERAKGNNIFENKLDFEIIWSQHISNRQRKCHYVIGSNGVGKSLMLSDFAMRCLADNNEAYVLLVAFGLADRFHAVRNYSPERCVYLGDRYGDKNISMSGRQQALNRSIYDVYNDEDKRLLAIRLLETFGLSSDVYFLPRDFLIQNNEFYSDKEIHNLDAIDTGNLISFDEISSNTLSFRKIGSSDAVLFTELSSGEQHVLIMMFRILAAIRKGCVVLIDEPETSLHVEWQQLLPKQFETIRKIFNISMIIATHSPILISAVQEQHGICYLAEKGRLRVINKEEIQNLESTLFEAFGVVTSNNRTIYGRCARIVADFMEAVNQYPESNLLISRVNALDELRMLKEKISRNKIKVASYARDNMLLTQAERAIDEVFNARDSEVDK